MSHQPAKFRHEEPLTREVSANGHPLLPKEGSHPTKSDANSTQHKGENEHGQIKANGTASGHPEVKPAQDHSGPRVGMFTGKVQEGMPSLFGHLPKPEFKDVFGKQTATAVTAVTTGDAKHAGHAQAPSKGKDGPATEKTDAVMPIQPQLVRTPTPAPAVSKPEAGPVNIFGKPVSEMFKNPAPSLFGTTPVAPSKPADAPQSTLFSNALFANHSKPATENSQPAPVPSLFGSNSITVPPSLFSNPKPGAIPSLFGSTSVPTGGLFAQGSSLFGNSTASQGAAPFGKFVIKKGNDDDGDSGDEGEGDDGDDQNAKSEDEPEPKDDKNAFVYDSPYEKVISLPFEDLKVDKKDGMGAGMLSIEKLKAAKPAADEGEKKDKPEVEAKADAPKGVRLEFPLLVVKTKAKVILSTYKLIPKRSNSAFLKNNKFCVSVVLYNIEKDEKGAQKLVQVNLKVKFTEEKMAEEFKEAFDQLVN